MLVVPAYNHTVRISVQNAPPSKFELIWLNGQTYTVDAIGQFGIIELPAFYVSIIANNFRFYVILLPFRVHQKE